MVETMDLPASWLVKGQPMGWVSMLLVVIREQLRFCSVCGGHLCQKHFLQVRTKQILANIYSFMSYRAHLCVTLKAERLPNIFLYCPGV